MPKLTIIVPVYNEREVIEDFIVRLNEFVRKNDALCECIVVDDNSDDGTKDLLKMCKAKVIFHEVNLGYGAALKTGIRKASGDIICTIDADGTHFPEDICKLMRFADDYSMVVGARLEAFRSFPFHQRIAKSFICSTLSRIFRQEVLDINSGLRLIRKSDLEKYLPVLCDGFSFSSSVTLAMLLEGKKIKYVPIMVSQGATKTKIEVISYTMNLLKSFWRVIRYCERKNTAGAGSKNRSLPGSCSGRSPGLGGK